MDISLKWMPTSVHVELILATVLTPLRKRPPLNGHLELILAMF